MFHFRAQEIHLYVQLSYLSTLLTKCKFNILKQFKISLLTYSADFLFLSHFTFTVAYTLMCAQILTK